MPPKKYSKTKLAAFRKSIEKRLEAVVNDLDNIKHA